MAGLDNNTKLYLPFDQNTLGASTVDGALEVLDSGNTGHILTQLGSAILTTATTKFAEDSSSLVLDGSSSYLTAPDSADWDVVASSSQDYTLDLWVKFDNATGTDEWFMVQKPNSNTYWYFARRSTGNLIKFVCINGGATVMNCSESVGGAIADTNWHHVAMTKVTSAGPTVEWAIYVDGTQIAYESDNSTLNMTSVLQIGYFQSGFDFDGNIAHARIQASNIFNATPVVGLTDTITVPASPDDYIVDANTKLYLPMQTQDQSGDGGSDAYHIPDFAGDAELDTAATPYAGGTSSLILEGAGYVELPYSDDLVHIIKNNADSTIDLWFRMASGGANSQLLYSWRFDGTANYIQAYMTNGKPAFYFYGGGEVATLDDQDTADLRDDTWHHCAVVRMTGGAWGTYIDGQQVDYDTGTGTSAGNSASFFIGCWNASSSFFDGQIAHFRTNASNIFDANPVVGQTDTITVPDAPYTAGDTPVISGAVIPRILTLGCG